MNRQDNREDDRLVTIKRRTMVVYKWRGHSIWLKDEDAERIVERSWRRRGEGRGIVAYIVRCRPKRAPSTSLNGDERSPIWPDEVESAREATQ